MNVRPMVMTLPRRDKPIVRRPGKDKVTVALDSDSSEVQATLVPSPKAKKLIRKTIKMWVYLLRTTVLGP